MASADPRVLVGSRQPVKGSGSRSAQRGWNTLGWFGLLLAVIGLADIGLYFYPLALSSPEWEFATVAAAFSSLPLASIGFAAVVAWLLVRGTRGQRLACAAVLVVLMLLMAAAYTVFLLNLPLALNAAAGPQGPAIHRAIARTTIMGLGFGSAFLVFTIALLRHTSSRETP